jgi:hypothetical protein
MIGLDHHIHEGYDGHMASKNGKQDAIRRALLDYDGTDLDFPGVYRITLRVWEVSPSLGIPHGLRYAFNLFAPSPTSFFPNNPLLRYDNEHAPIDRTHPYDHRHGTARGPGGFPKGHEVDGKALNIPPEKLVQAFLDESFALLDELGVTNP